MNRVFPYLAKDAAFFVIVATVAFCIGFLINQFRDDPLELVYQTKEQRIMKEVSRASENLPKEAPDSSFPEYIAIGDFKKLLKANERVVVVDARPEIFHRAEHIPGAYSLSREDFSSAYERLAPILAGDKDRKIVVYCSSSSCQDSDLVRKALLALGYTRVAILRGGWAAWKAESGNAEGDEE